CSGEAGAVFALEASRLARNGRDWHTLLEFCALVGSLIIDEDGVYDPRLVNDRLLLGMKGAFSELELSTLRQRSQEALRLKAARGDLHTTVAIGYRRSVDDRLEQDPDRRIREALSLVFRKFREIGSVRQLVLWLRQEGIDLPTAVHSRHGRTVRWDPPRYHAVHRLLTNPVYAGAYVFGRTLSRTRVEGGRKVIIHGVARRREDWTVLIQDHHDGYITWEEYDRNLAIIAGNANMKGSMVAGAVRNGSALLVCLLRCGRCGRKFKVLHHSRRDARYVCASHVDPSREKGCTAFNLETAVGRCEVHSVSEISRLGCIRLGRGGAGRGGGVRGGRPGRRATGSPARFAGGSTAPHFWRGPAGRRRRRRAPERRARPWRANSSRGSSSAVRVACGWRSPSGTAAGW